MLSLSDFPKALAILVVILTSQARAADLELSDAAASVNQTVPVPLTLNRGQLGAVQFEIQVNSFNVRIDGVSPLNNDVDVTLTNVGGGVYGVLLIHKNNPFSTAIPTGTPFNFNVTRLRGQNTEPLELQNISAVTTSNSPAILSSQNSNLLFVPVAPDINNDNQVDSLDVIAVLAVIHDSNLWTPIMDVNLDNVVNVLDAAFIHFNFVVVGGSNPAPTSQLADFNGDGIPDLLITAEGDDSSFFDGGSVHVFFGPISSNQSINNADVTFQGDGGSQEFGISATAADMNGDGITDVVVGSRNGEGGLGAVKVFYGSATLSGTLSASSADLTFVGPNTSSEFGFSLDAKDINGDGIADLLVGRNASVALGTAFLFLSPYSSNSISSSNADVTFQGEGLSDFFGRKVSFLKDLNGDQIPDIAIASLGLNGAGNYPNGAVHIYFSPIANGTLQTSAADLTILGESSNSQFGTSIESGQILGDSSTDLIIGARFASNGNSVTTGVAYVFEGPFTAGTTLDSVNANLRIEGDQADEEFAASILLEDLDNDGQLEIIVGSPRHDLQANSVDTGRVSIFHGPFNSGSLSASNATTLITGNGARTKYGSGLGFGDLNNDGLRDLIFGGPGSSTLPGYVSIFHGGAALSPSLTSSDANATITSGVINDTAGRNVVGGR